MASLNAFGKTNRQHAARSRRAVDVISRAYSRTVLGLYGVHVAPSGLELLPEQPAVYLFNHQSHMDPVSIEATIARSIRFGAKIELFSIPIFGAGLRAAGILPIARDNLKDVLSVYREAAGRFADGFSYVLAPEGKRQEEARIEVRGWRPPPRDFQWRSCWIPTCHSLSSRRRHVQRSWFRPFVLR